jgi:hypothetical protein
VLTTFGGMVIDVKARHGVGPYLEIPMPRSMKGWQKKWFCLRNDASAPLPAFISGRPVPLASWGVGVARKNLSKMQPLHENLQQLRQEELTRMHLLRTFFSHQIQLLRRQRTKMWMYPRSSYPARPSSEELSAAEVEAQIHMVLDLGVNPNSGADPVPLRRGISSVRVSTLGPASVAFIILSFHYAHNLAQSLRGGRGEPWDADLPSDAARREVRHPSSEEMRAREERERDRHAARRAKKRRGMEATPRSVSSSEGEVESGATLPPSSPPFMNHSPHWETIS